MSFVNRPLTLLPATALSRAQNFPSISRKECLLDAYEYVMYGLVYKYQSETANKEAGVKVSVFVSFGGLLMKLTGDPAKLNVLEVDSKVYLLMRKV
jgi:DNA-directed RNA polymerase I, II, and III subunit RPABC3